MNQKKYKVNNTIYSLNELVDVYGPKITILDLAKVNKLSIGQVFTSTSTHIIRVN